jgi:hypothetical protein
MVITEVMKAGGAPAFAGNTADAIKVPVESAGKASRRSKRLPRKKL